MFTYKIVLFYLMTCASLFVTVNSTAEILRDVTLGFGEALKHCREESQLTEDMMEEFYHFWREDFEFEHRELGCAIQCMSRYFEIIDDNERLHHTKADEFIKSFPDGEKLSSKMIEMLHACEQKFDHEEDDCLRVLHSAECFKHSAASEGIAPHMDMLMVEFILEN